MVPTMADKGKMSRKYANLAVTTKAQPCGGTVSSYEAKDKTSYKDKQCGSYGRVTTKESVSSGDYVNRGRTGYKDEYKTSTTVRHGDGKGFTEYLKQERFTRVNYDRSASSSKGIQGCTKGSSGGSNVSSHSNGYSHSDDEHKAYNEGDNSDDDVHDNDDDSSDDDGHADGNDAFSDDNASYGDTDDDDASFGDDDDSYDDDSDYY